MAQRGSATTAASVVQAMTVACDKPTGVVAGDFMIAFGNCGSSGVFTPPSGWTQIDAGATGWFTRAWWKVAGGSEPANYSWTETVNSTMVISILAFSGVSNATPIDAHSLVEATTTATVTGPTVTATRAGGYALYARHLRSSVTTNRTCSTTDGTVTELVDFGTNGNTVAIYLSNATKSAGSVAGIPTTASSTITNGTSQTIVLFPEVDAGAASETAAASSPVASIGALPGQGAVTSAAFSGVIPRNAGAASTTVAGLSPTGAISALPSVATTTAAAFSATRTITAGLATATVSALNPTVAVAVAPAAGLATSTASALGATRAPFDPSTASATATGLSSVAASAANTGVGAVSETAFSATVASEAKPNVATPSVAVFGGAVPALENRYFISSRSGTATTPNNALNISDGTFTADTGSTSWTHSWFLDTPTAALATFGGLQSFVFTVRQSSTTTNNPVINSITLQVQTGASTWTPTTLLGVGTQVTSATTQDIYTTCDSSAFAGAFNMTGHYIEIVTTGSSGGSPSSRQAVQIDACRWMVAYLGAQPTPTQATVTGTALSVAVAVTVNAGLATVGATAYGAVRPINAGAASVTATALSPTIPVNAGAATVGATAYDAVRPINAGAAAVTAAALAPAITEAVNAGLVTVSAAGLSPSVAETVNTGTASATVAAFNPSVGNTDLAPASLAAVTASASDASIPRTAGVATASVAAFSPTVNVSPLPTAGTESVTAYNATISITCNTTAAAAAASGLSAVVSEGILATLAIATVVAPNAGISSTSNTPAGLGASTVAAFGASISIAPSPTAATVSAVALLAGISHPAGLAAVSATALNPVLNIMHPPTPGRTKAFPFENRLVPIPAENRTKVMK